MEALLLPPSQEPQNQITNPANSKPNHQSGDVHKDETMMMKKKKDTNPSNLEKRKLKGKKKEIMDNDEASSSYCSTSSTSNSNSTKRVTRVVHRLRNPMRLGMARRSVGERQAEKLAKPLGFSLAAFANMLIARKNAAGQNVYVDDLVEIFATLVEESLANVYGNKLGSFATNFEQTFSSTLKILKLTNECANPHQSNNNDGGSCNLDRSTIDGCSDTELFERETSSATSAYEVMQGSATATSLMNELALFEETLQLSCVPPRSSAMALTTDERFLKEQTRANDLKTVEIGLQIRELRCKETALGLKFESNNLGKAALELDVSKAAFRAEKFKTELEDTRKEEMVTRIMDWLLVSVFSMLASMVLGVYNFSIKRIEDATSVCDQSEEKSSSWWVPKQVSSINSGFNTFICRVRVWVQIFFGVLMIIVFTYFLNKRSSGTKQTMPISFIVLFLGIFCGVSGKLCVDTLGGDGKLWLLVWEVFCLLQFVANVFTLALYGLMFGPINVTQETRSNRCNSMFPYWARRSVVYVVILFVLPVINGLLPFATFGEWRDFAMYHLHGGSDYA